MRVRFIDTGRIWLDGGAMFGVVPKVIWRTLTPTSDLTHTAHHSKATAPKAIRV